jgi:hypothetical protein
VAREDGPPIVTSDPARYSRDDEEVEVPNEYLMTLARDIEFVPARDALQATEQSGRDFTKRQIDSHTPTIDRTIQWEWAALRETDIQHATAAEKAAALPRPKPAEELAIDRVDLGWALDCLTDGELRAVLLRAAGIPLRSGERVQLMRALEKTSELRKQNGLAVSIEGERDIEKIAQWIARAVVAAYPTKRFPDADELIAACLRVNRAA